MVFSVSLFHFQLKKECFPPVTLNLTYEMTLIDELDLSLISLLRYFECQVTLVINSAAGYHYIPSDPRLSSQLHGITAVGRYQFILLGEQWHKCANDLHRVAALRVTAEIEPATSRSLLQRLS